LDDTGTLAVWGHDSIERSFLSLSVGIGHGHTLSIQDLEALGEELNKRLWLLALSNAVASAATVENTTKELLSHGLSASGLFSACDVLSLPVDYISVLSTNNINNIDLFIEEHADFISIFNLLEVFKVLTHDEHIDSVDLTELLINEVSGLQVLVGESTDVLFWSLLSLDAPEALEVRHEEGVLAALGDTGDGGTLWFLPLLLLVDGDSHAGVLLISRGVFALPNHDLVVQLKDVGVLLKKHFSPEWTVSDLVASNFTVLLTNMPETVLSDGVLVELLHLFFLILGWLHVSGAATKSRPEEILHISISWEVELSSHLSHVVLEVIGVVESSQLLIVIGSITLPVENFITQIQDVAVALAQLLSRDFNWENSWVSLTDNAKELVNVGLWHIVLEARSNTTVQVSDTTWEARQEQVRLLVHQLQVVHGSHVEVVVETIGELCSESSSAASLIRGRVLALPVVNIELLHTLEDAHIRISIVKLSKVLVNVDRSWREVLNSVHLYWVRSARVKESLRLLSELLNVLSNLFVV